MSKRQTLEEMADQLYDDPELSAAVVQDADRLKTRDKIITGQLTLPHPSDAREWLDRKQGKVPMTDREKAQEQVIRSQEERLSKLEQAISKKEEA